MIARQLDVDLVRPRVLRIGIREAEHRAATDRRRVPPGHPPRDESAVGVDGHHRPGVAAAYESPDPLPRAVAELDHRVVPEALQDVDHEHVPAAQADLAEQRVEQPPGLTHERQPLLVLVRSGRLADEHEVRVRVARAEHHGVPRGGQLRAAGAGPRLLPDGLELLPPLHRIGHEPNLAGPPAATGRIPHDAGYHPESRPSPRWDGPRELSPTHPPAAGISCENWTRLRRSPRRSPAPAPSSARAGWAPRWPPRCAPPGCPWRGRSGVASRRTRRPPCCSASRTPPSPGRPPRSRPGRSSGTARAPRGSARSARTRASRCIR